MRLFQVNKATIWFLLLAFTLSFFLCVFAAAMAAHWKSQYYALKNSSPALREITLGSRFEVTARGRGCVDLDKYPNYKAEDNANCIEGYSSVWDIDVLHDKSSGAEFICASGDHQLSCFTTGRIWK